jgi:hypothetical protein
LGDVGEWWATLVSSGKRDLSHKCMGVHQINPHVYPKHIVLAFWIGPKRYVLDPTCKNKSNVTLSKMVHFTLANNSYQKFDDMDFIGIFTNPGNKFSD